MPPPHNPAADGFAELRLAVISPFLDRLHGTERCIVEQLERLAVHDEMQIHIYSQRVEGLHGVVRYRHSASPGRIFWHKVPRLPGPHLFGYVSWFIANHLLRFWDSRIRGLKFDLLYSPGINAFDADVVAVHIVFHELYKHVPAHLRFQKAAVSEWPRLLHRLLYYRLIMLLERFVYPSPKVSLTSVSGMVAKQLADYFQRGDAVVIPNSVDAARFSPDLRTEMRRSARDSFRLSACDFVLLFIGNDFKKKGLDCLLAALASCRELNFKLLIVGSDERTEYESMVRTFTLNERVIFLDASSDVMQFYAAADAYVGPSLEDAYGLPIVEAMACGLPVVASARAGVSEIIVHRKNGMILRDPQDSAELAELLRELHVNSGAREQMGREAAQTAGQQTWDGNVAALWQLLNQAAAKKRRSPVVQESY